MTEHEALALAIPVVGSTVAGYHDLHSAPTLEDDETLISITLTWRREDGTAIREVVVLADGTVEQ